MLFLAVMEAAKCENTIDDTPGSGSEKNGRDSNSNILFFLVIFVYFEFVRKIEKKSFLCPVIILSNVD